jgi:hypothetical protein
VRGIIGIVKDALIGHGKTVDIVIDSDAGPIFVRAGSLPEGTVVYPLPSNIPGLVSANGSPLNLRGFVKIGVQVGDLVEEESLMVSDALPVEVLLGTGWIEKYVRMIPPNQGVAELSTGSAVSLLRRVLGKKAYVRCARDMVVPPLTEVSLAVKSEWRGLGVAVSSKR